MEKIFFEIDNEDFVLHIMRDESWKEGEVYPIQKYESFKNGEGSGWGYLDVNDNSIIDSSIDARKLFNFSFVWRGVWEGRIYFKDDEYWSEELSTISKLWDAIEVKMKDRIKQQNPENTYDA